MQLIAGIVIGALIGAVSIMGVVVQIMHPAPFDRSENNDNNTAA